MGKVYSYDDFLEIINRLRGEGGCPWDREQTHESLKVNLVEECYELVEAIENADTELMKEELGDVLLQVVMHAQIAKEENAFSMEEVVQSIAEKMVRRHPHVFKEGDKMCEGIIESSRVKTTQDVLANWEVIKSQEKEEKSIVQSMDRVAKTLPALMRTQKIQKKAMKFQNQTVDIDRQIDNIIKELERLKQENLQENHKDLQRKNERKSAIEEEFGKIMFEVVNLSTFFDINAEFTLTKSLEKFINRFRYIENSRFKED